MTLVHQVPEASVEALARRLGAAPAVDARIAVRTDGIVVRKARSGRIVDAAALQAKLSTLPDRVVVPTLAVEPRIGTKAASL